MAIAAQEVIRAWVNSNPDLVGAPPGTGPLARGAYLWEQASPAEGAYARLQRMTLAPALPAAEPGPFDVARISALIYGGKQSSAELAAAAYATAVRDLAGLPVRVPETRVSILVAAGLTGPSYVPQPPDTGELYCFQVLADFTLRWN